MGRLQRLRQGRPCKRAQQAVLHGGPSGGECRRKGVLRVQGRGESSPLSAALQRRRLISRRGSIREHARIDFFSNRTFLSWEPTGARCAWPCTWRAPRSVQRMLEGGAEKKKKKKKKKKKQ